MKCPCVTCEKAGCGAYHDSCERYAEWRKEKDAAIARRNEQAEQTNYVIAARLRIRGKIK